MISRWYFCKDTFSSICSHLPHLWEYGTFKIIFLGTGSHIQVSLKLLIGKFVVRLIFTVFRIVFLDCVICQVNFWLKNVNIKLIGWCTNVSLFIPISSHDSKKVSYQHIMSYIKFSIVVKKRPIYVTLDNESLCCLTTFGWLLFCVLFSCFFTLTII